MTSIMNVSALNQEEGSDSLFNVMTDEGNVMQPPSKRQCTQRSSDPTLTHTDTDHKIGGDMSKLDLPLPIPQPAVGHLNVRQDGIIRHDYGTGHQQVNITHCGRIENQVLGLGLPQLYVNPPEISRNHNEMNDFNRQVVSIF